VCSKLRPASLFVPTACGRLPTHLTDVHHIPAPVPLSSCPALPSLWGPQDGEWVPCKPYHSQPLWYNLVLLAGWGQGLHLAAIDLVGVWVGAGQQCIASSSDPSCILRPS
jgi:hypothetical protein